MEQRKRINVSQGAKGDWKIEATVEITGTAPEEGEVRLENGYIAGQT